MRKRSTTRTIVKAALYGIAAGAIGGVALHLYNQPPARVLAGPHTRAATLIVPDGGGRCRRLLMSNDAPVLIDQSVVPCESVRTASSSLPPVLQGYQQSLRPAAR